MAQTAGVLLTYGDQAIREDVVMNSLEILTAREDFIQNMLGKTDAISTVHSYLVDTLRTAATMAVAEGTTDVLSANSTPTRLTNIIQLSRLPFGVSDIQSGVTHYTGEDELMRQTNKALMDFANSMEFDLVRQTLASGISGTAAKLSGLIEATSKANNHTSHTSTTVWAASILESLMALQWTNSNGDFSTMATDIFMSGYLRTVSDTFTQKTNVVVTGSGITTIVKTLTVYETSFGPLKLHQHRYIYQSGTDPHARVLALNPAKFRIAYLKGGKPMIDNNVGRIGPWTPKAIQAMWTLETRNQNAAWYADGFVPA